MNIEDLQKICDKLPGVTQDIKWEEHLCFNVGGKMFLITSPDSVPVTASFKMTDDEFEELVSRQGFKPSAYLAKHKWIHVEDIKRLTKKEWTNYLSQSYHLIAAKLTLKVRKQLGLITKK
jgi:predicted DNA-binding protein (MmcQ/YjbR family)